MTEPKACIGCGRPTDRHLNEPSPFGRYLAIDACSTRMPPLPAMAAEYRALIARSLIKEHRAWSQGRGLS